MANILPRHFFYSIIIFALIITGVYTIISIVMDESMGADASNQLMSDEDLKYFNDTLQVENLEDDINDIRGGIERLEPSQKWGILDVVSLPLAFIETAWDSIKLVISSFTMMDDSIEGATAYFDTGEKQNTQWVSGFIITLIGAFLVFSILSLIFGKDI